MISLELLKMPTDYFNGQESIFVKSSRRFIITINDVIIEDIREYQYPEKDRAWFDSFVKERIKTFEIALKVKARKNRGFTSLEAQEYST